MPALHLTGCAPIPLAHYRKAIGLLNKLVKYTCDLFL